MKALEQTQYGLGVSMWKTTWSRSSLGGEGWGVGGDWGRGEEEGRWHRLTRYEWSSVSARAPIGRIASVVSRPRLNVDADVRCGDSVCTKDARRGGRPQQDREVRQLSAYKRRLLATTVESNPIPCTRFDVWSLTSHNRFQRTRDRWFWMQFSSLYFIT